MTEALKEVKELEKQYWVSIEEDWYDMGFKVSVFALASLAKAVNEGTMVTRVAEPYMKTWVARSEFCLDEVKEQADPNLFDVEH